MELICTSCFTNPIEAQSGVEHDSAEMLICNSGAIAPPYSFPGDDALHCRYCGSTVHLNQHPIAWYAR